MDKLLTRDAFREGVFNRDSHKCVICGNPAKDAHHIIERRLWSDSGYYLDNGASLCEEHHLAAESTTLTCEEVRAAAKITKIILPEHLYDDTVYDKWGNIILVNGSRLKGELFHDESVQKILKTGNALQYFTNYVKYPRTHHFPWSPGMSKDDRVLKSLDAFIGQRVIGFVKMDGENTTMYRDYIHARSMDYSHHPSRSWVRNLHGKIAHEIPEGWRISGENLYAEHSIHYKDLESYFYVFAIWDDKNRTLPWDEVKDYCGILNLNTCPTIYDDIWDEERIKKLYTPTYNGNTCEGYVVWRADSIAYGDFRHKVGKYVRKGHVNNNHGHWAKRMVTPNELR